MAGTRVSAVAAAALGIGAIALGLSGCATIVSGSDQEVNIRSEPSEATITIFDANGMTVQTSKTPTVAVLKKGRGYFQGASYRIVVEKPGYKRTEIVLTSGLNAGWYLVGNLLFGGLIGWLIVDPASGAMWTLSPDNVSLQLAAEASFLRQKDGLMIMLLEDVPQKVRAVLRPAARGGG